MRRFLFLTLALLLTAIAAHAEPVIGDNDTLWTKPYTGIKGVKFHPSGETVVVSREGNGLFELDAETGEFIRAFTHSLPLPSENTYWDFDISSDGNYLFGTDYNHRCFLWDYHTGNVIRGFNNLATHCRFLNDNTIIANLFLDPYYFWIYSMAQDSIILTESRNVNHSPRISAMAVSPDGRYFALASVDKDYYGNTVNSLALYNAQTFEQIIDINKNEPNMINEIVFSENAKWIGYKTGSGYSKILNLYTFLQNGEKNIKEFKWSSTPCFLGNENYYLYSTYEPRYETFLINLSTQDTVYYFNYGLFNFSSNFVDKKIVCKRSISGDIYMLNSHWFQLDVPDIVEDSAHITQLNYNNYLLSYTTNLIQINSITITDSIGTTLYSNSYYCQPTGIIEISLPSGIYFFTINDGQNSYTKKFLVVY